METTSSMPDTSTIFPKWWLIMFIGWSFKGLVVWSVDVHSWAEFQPLVIAYGLNGLIIGLLVGLAQTFILRRRLRAYEILVLAVLHAIGLSLGLLVSSASALPFLPGAPNVFMTIGFGNTAPIAGLLIGLGQWFILRGQVLPNTRPALLIWVLLHILALAIAGAVAQIGINVFGLGNPVSLPAAIVAHGLAGLSIGAVTGIALVWVRQSRFLSTNKFSEATLQESR